MKRTKPEAAETRSSILAAAERIFFEKGVASSTLDEIAAAAGVTRGAIYWHFESKNDLLVALLDPLQFPHFKQLAMEAVGRTKPYSLADIEKMVCLWLETLGRRSEHQRRTSILLRTNLTDELEQFLVHLRRLDEQQTLILRSMLEEAALNGELAPGWTPETSSRTVSWLVKGIYWEWLLFGRRFDLAAHGGASISALFASFRAP